MKTDDLNQSYFDPSKIFIRQTADQLTDDVLPHRRDLFNHGLRPLLKSVFHTGFDRGSEERGVEQMRGKRTGEYRRVDIEEFIRLEDDGRSRLAKLSRENCHHHISSTYLHGLSQSVGPTATVHWETSSVSAAAAMDCISF